jgi:hypothetical protein
MRGNEIFDFFCIIDFFIKNFFQYLINWPYTIRMQFMVDLYFITIIDHTDAI